MKRQKKEDELKQKIEYEKKTEMIKNLTLQASKELVKLGQEKVGLCYRWKLEYQGRHEKN